MSRPRSGSTDDDRGPRLPLPVLVEGYRWLGWPVAGLMLATGATLTTLAALSRDVAAEVAGVILVGAIFTVGGFVTPLIIVEALSLLALLYGAVRRLEDRVEALAAAINSDR